MHFKSNLAGGKIVRRYKRILVDIALDDGRYTTALCNNMADLPKLFAPQTDIWVSRTYAANRRVRHIAEMVFSGGGLVGVNPALGRPVATEAIEMGRIPELSDYENVLWNAGGGHGSHIDLMLQGEDIHNRCYVGILDVFDKIGTNAIFPDGVNIANHRQIVELGEARKEGVRAVLLLLVHRMDCLGLRLSWDKDPAFAALLTDAQKLGVEVISYNCVIDLRSVWVEKRLELLNSPNRNNNV